MVLRFDLWDSVGLSVQLRVERVKGVESAIQSVYMPKIGLFMLLAGVFIA